VKIACLYALVCVRVDNIYPLMSQGTLINQCLHLGMQNLASRSTHTHTHTHIYIYVTFKCCASLFFLCVWILHFWTQDLSCLPCLWVLCL